MVFRGQNGLDSFQAFSFHRKATRRLHAPNPKDIFRLRVSLRKVSTTQNVCNFFSNQDIVFAGIATLLIE
jgi:hypothetical protein